MITRRSLIAGSSGLIITPQILLAAATSVDIDITAAHSPVPGDVGPQPLPDPYPLQPGFTPISDGSQLSLSSPPGNYQLMSDTGLGASLPTKSVIDAGGHTISGTGGVTSIFLDGTTLKNAIVHDIIFAVLSNASVINCTIASDGRAQTYLLYGTPSNSLIKNNLLTGAWDDAIQFSGYPGQTDVTIVNNIIGNSTADMAIEAMSGWNNYVIKRNYFKGVNAAMGNFQNAVYTNCKILDNLIEKSSVNHMFFFNDSSAEDDASATSAYNGVFIDSIFSGNSWV